MRAAMAQTAPLSLRAPRPGHASCGGHRGRTAQASRAQKITGSATGFLNALQGTTTASAKITWKDGTTTSSKEWKSAWQGQAPQWLWDIYKGSDDGRKHRHDAEVAVLWDLAEMVDEKIKADKAAFKLKEDAAEATFNQALAKEKADGFKYVGAAPKYKRKAFVNPTGSLKFSVSQNICEYCRSAIAVFCSYYGLTEGEHSIAL
jgi:hypothetical protein